MPPIPQPPSYEEFVRYCAERKLAEEQQQQPYNSNTIFTLLEGEGETANLDAANDGDHQNTSIEVHYDDEEREPTNENFLLKDGEYAEDNEQQQADEESENSNEGLQQNDAELQLHDDEIEKEHDEDLGYFSDLCKQ